MADEPKVPPEGGTGETPAKPAPASGSGVEDLRVRAMARDKVVAEYSIPDPRLVETEDQKWQLLPSARTFVYVPLSTEITALSISPLPGRTRASKGGTIPVLDLAKRACAERTQVETCRRIMQMQ